MQPFSALSGCKKQSESVAHINIYIFLKSAEQLIWHPWKAFILVLEGTLNLLTVGTPKWVSHVNVFYITKTKPKVAFPAFMLQESLAVLCWQKAGSWSFGGYTRSAPLLESQLEPGNYYLRFGLEHLSPQASVQASRDAYSSPEKGGV